MAADDTKRIEPDSGASNAVLVKQLRAYAGGAPRHSWSRRWMGIAADRLDPPGVEAAESAKREALYWDCCESEELIHTEIAEAVAEWLDNQHPTPIDQLPETIEVIGHAPLRIPSGGRSGALENLLECIDEDYGSPDRYTEPTDAMKEAEHVFIEAVTGEYVVWSCEPVDRVTINVAEWIRENAPEWLEETG